MKKIFLSLISIGFILYLSQNSINAAGIPTSDYYGYITNSVIRLGRLARVPLDGISQRQLRIVPPMGTAFFVCYKSDIFVVSAKHNVLRDQELHARVQVLNENTGRNEIFLLRLLKDSWKYLPASEAQDTHDIDVAAARISWLEGYAISCIRFNPEEPNHNDFFLDQPKPPTPILVFGFPMDIGFMLKEQRPIGRFGIVSMVSGEKFLKVDNKYFSEKAFLIDSNMFRGNSGSPVMRQIMPWDRKLALLGLVVASNDTLQFAVAEPASSIGEAIKLAAEGPVDNVECWTGPLQ